MESSEVVSKCVLNNISSFHLVHNYFADITHDTFEDVCHYTDSCFTLFYEYNKMCLFTCTELQNAKL